MLELNGHATKGVFHGKNVITPHVVGYVKLLAPLGWAELSWGQGILDPAGELWGVTVRTGREANGNADSLRSNHLSRCFRSRAEAESYIEELLEPGKPWSRPMGQPTKPMMQEPIRPAHDTNEPKPGDESDDGIKVLEQ